MLRGLLLDGARAIDEASVMGQLALGLAYGCTQAEIARAVNTRPETLSRKKDVLLRLLLRRLNAIERAAR